MTRRGAPALYELMRRPGTPVDAAPRAAPRAAPSPAAVASRTGRAPGLPDSFTISLGRAAAIAAGVVVLVAIAYGIGVQRGRAIATRGGSEPATIEPAAPAPARSGATGVAGGAASRPTTTPARPAATDNKGDPRIKGERYFVLAHPSSDRASEMVEFCRANGLDAYLVPDDNALLRKVIVLPGYKDASQKSSPDIKALEAKIRSVGEKWKKLARGNKDFGDAYPELFR
jgi:hypothetical protein